MNKALALLSNYYFICLTCKNTTDKVRHNWCTNTSEWNRIQFWGFVTKDNHRHTRVKTIKWGFHYKI